MTGVFGARSGTVTATPGPKSLGLLPQPGSFERFGFALKLLVADDLSVTQRVDGTHAAAAHLDAAASTAEAHTGGETTLSPTSMYSVDSGVIDENAS